MFEKLIPSLALSLLVPFSAAAEQPAAPKLFELRDYRAAEGGFDPLLSRFRDHTVALFTKHGMTNVGYWTPVENANGRFIYLRGFKDMDNRAATTGTFKKDPEWREALEASQKGGKLIANIDSLFLEETDFSPGFSELGQGPHVFEMRTYIATPGNLSSLHARFKEHTLSLFEKHGMISLGYYQLLPDQEGADNTLIYFLAHKDQESAKKSWAAFAADPDWVAAKKESEEKAGGSLTEKNGVKSVFLKPTDFSPAK